MKNAKSCNLISVVGCRHRPRYKDMTKEKGITLVALIITIIVLIILAAVTIFAFTESGLLKTASKGTENYANVQEYEKQIMDNIDKHVQNIVKDITEGSGNGGGGEKPPTPELPEGWESSKVYAVQSADSTKVTVPIPIGFVMSGIEEEKKVSTGLVIYEIPENEREGISWTADTNGNNYPDVQERYNQFVWVPVAEPSEMFGIDKDGNYLGKLYTFSKSGEQTVVTANNWTETTNADGKKIMSWSSSAGNREPDILTSYDNTATYYTNAEIKDKDGNAITTSAQLETELQNEFKAMKESVEKYNGFYIGRYETGNLSQNKAVVAKGNTDIGDQSWYVQYQKNKTVIKGKSSMVWGCQWDAVMKWFLSSEDAGVRTYVIDSAGKGNYAGTQGNTNTAIPTGSNDDYRVNNIYDMAGNVWDWTNEASSSYFRVYHRGFLQR